MGVIFGTSYIKIKHYVILLLYACTGVVGETTKNMYQLADEVLVKVKNADLVKRHLDFNLIGRVEK